MVSTVKRSPAKLVTTSPRMFVVTTIVGFSTVASSLLEGSLLEALLLEALLLEALLLEAVLLALSLLLLQAVENKEIVAMNTVTRRVNRFRKL